MRGMKMGMLPYDMPISTLNSRGLPHGALSTQTLVVHVLSREVLTHCAPLMRHLSMRILAVGVLRRELLSQWAPQMRYLPMRALVVRERSVGVVKECVVARGCWQILLWKVR